MTKIYLIRHAEAEGNYYRRIHGQYNSKITSRGYLQIDALAERFRDIHIDALYSSDLTRTMETSKAITKYHDLTLVPDKRLREIYMGCWEDLPWGNAAYDAPEQMLLFANDPDNWMVEGAESFAHLQERVSSTVRELAAKHDGQTIAIVSHGMAIRSIICGILGIPSERIHEVLHGDNTCVALLCAENGELSVEYYNDNSHLNDELSTFANQTWWKNKSKVDFTNLRIVPLDIDKDAKLYIDCYADAWMAAHNSLVGFSPDPYIESAKRIAKHDRNCLSAAYYGDYFAGIVELDPVMMSYLGSGWISFCYLTQAMRGQGYGAQLVGQAVSVFREKGRSSLRLHVAETNTNAIAFYKKMGFSIIATDDGIICPLYLMELPI